MEAARYHIRLGLSSTLRLTEVVLQCTFFNAKGNHMSKKSELPQRKWLRTRCTKDGIQLWYSVPREEYEKGIKERDEDGKPILTWREYYEDELEKFLRKK